jgi:ribosome-binding protein aMBF1 (putative translation factor)
MKLAFDPDLGRSSMNARKVRLRRSSGRPSASKPNPVDIQIGNRLRKGRAQYGFSQQRLAEALRLTFQQIQKYERGKNRISASRLWEISKVLGCPISYFFEEIEDNAGATERY